MKKLILLISATTLFFACSKSSSDDAPVAPPTILISRLENTKNGVTKTDNITYNGNKIVKVSLDGNQEIRYTYNGNLIVSLEDFTNNVPRGGSTFTYDGDKLIRVFRTEISTGGPAPTTYKNRIDFVHNTDGTINFKRYSISATNVETLSSEGKYTYVNGNLTKKENNETSFSEVIIYTYDTKNNGLRNILGFDKLIENEQFCLNNVLTSRKTATAPPTGGNPPSTSTVENVYSYVYNLSNYPTSAVRTQTEAGPFGSSTNTRTTNFFY